MQYATATELRKLGGIEMSDGLWCFPGQKLAKAPQGYAERTGEPGIYEPLLDDCTKRRIETKQLQCCKDYKIMLCDGKQIHHDTCMVCKTLAAPTVAKK